MHIPLPDKGAFGFTMEGAYPPSFLWHPRIGTPTGLLVYASNYSRLGFLLGFPCFAGSS